jgi:hypothetical protein
MREIVEEMIEAIDVDEEETPSSISRSSSRSGRSAPMPLAASGRPASTQAAPGADRTGRKTKSGKKQADE